MQTKSLTAHDWGDYNKSESVNKIFISNKQELKHYINAMVVPILNCAFIENKYLFFKDCSVFKICIK